MKEWPTRVVLIVDYRWELEKGSTGLSNYQMWKGNCWSNEICDGLRDSGVVFVDGIMSKG